MPQNPLSRNPGVTLGCYMRKLVRHGLGGLKDNASRYGAVRNDQFAPILGYGDLVQGNVTIKRESTCFVRDLQGNDLLTGTRGFYLYTIGLHECSSPTPICFMAKASTTQAWLWHRRLSHLNFDTINRLSKNDIVNGLQKLKFIKDHL
ncbi:retrovirus-related pol polyprotein from transposon TNT 1-94, partial [Tanacetum coccineum]